MKSYPPERLGITLLIAPEGSPNMNVSLIRSEGFKFLAGINHNTSIYDYHTDEHHYYMLIACKELHWDYPITAVCHLAFFIVFSHLEGDSSPFPDASD